MILLNQFVTAVIPQRQTFYLFLRIDIRCGASSVLRARAVKQGEHVLMVQQKRCSREFHAGYGGHAGLQPERRDMRNVGAHAIVFGTWGKLDVFGRQIENSPNLAARVVARRRTVTVKIGADPARRFDGLLEFGSELCGTSFPDLQRGEFRVVLRTVTDNHVVLTGRQRNVELSVCCIGDILHEVVTGRRPPVRR